MVISKISAPDMANDMVRFHLLMTPNSLCDGYQSGAGKHQQYHDPSQYLFGSARLYPCDREDGLH